MFTKVTNTVKTGTKLKPKNNWQNKTKTKTKKINQNENHTDYSEGQYFR